MVKLDRLVVHMYMYTCYMFVTENQSFTLLLKLQNQSVHKTGFHGYRSLYMNVYLPCNTPLYSKFVSGGDVSKPSILSRC